MIVKYFNHKIYLIIFIGIMSDWRMECEHCTKGNLYRFFLLESN